LNNTNQIENINKDPIIFNPEKHCAVCKTNGSLRKWTFYFSYNRKARVCCKCSNNFLSSADVSLWLEKNAIYDKKTGELIDFQIGVKK